MNDNIKVNEQRMGTSFEFLKVPGGRALGEPADRI